MDKYTKSRKCLVIGIIFLFLGIAIQPITSINIIQIEKIKSNDKVNDSHSEEGCNCNDVVTQDLARVNRLLDKIEVNIKNILLTYGYIPDIKYNCNEILDILKSIGRNGLICNLLKVIFKTLELFSMYFVEKANECYNSSNVLLYKIYNSIFLVVWLTGMVPTHYTAALLDCSWIDGEPYFNLLFGPEVLYERYILDTIGDINITKPFLFGVHQHRYFHRPSYVFY
jgi:hypothetical protein